MNKKWILLVVVALLMGIIAVKSAREEKAAADVRAAMIASIEVAEPKMPAVEKDWVLNVNTKKYHKTSCPSVTMIKEANRRDVHVTREAVIAQGFEPCGKCHS